MQLVTILDIQDVNAVVATLLGPLQQQITDLTARVTKLETVPPPVSTSPSGKEMDLFVPNGWKVAVREDFEIDCSEGQFGTIYGPRQIGFYPGPGETSAANYGTANGGTDGYKDTSKRGTYTGKFISVSGSVLKQRGFVDAATGKIWVSSLCPFAKIGGTSKWGDVPAYIFEQRTRFPIMDDGFKLAHLGWPISNSNELDGEIDWPEAEKRLAKGYVHHPNPTVNGLQTVITPNPAIDISQWHTWRTEWAKGQYVRLFCDGVLQGQVTDPSKLPNNLMHHSLQNETSLLRNSSGLIPVPATAKYEVHTDWLQYLIPA